MAREYLAVFEDCLTRAKEGAQSRLLGVELLQRHPIELIPVVLYWLGKSRSPRSSGARSVIYAWVQSKPQRELLIRMITLMVHFRPVDFQLLRLASRSLCASLRLSSCQSTLFLEFCRCIIGDGLSALGLVEQAHRIVRGASRRLEQYRIGDPMCRIYLAYSLAVRSHCLNWSGRRTSAQQLSERALNLLPQRGGGIGRMFVRYSVLSAYCKQRNPDSTTVQQEALRELEADYRRRCEEEDEASFAVGAPDVDQRDSAELFLALQAQNIDCEREMVVELEYYRANAERDQEGHLVAYLEAVRSYGFLLICRHRGDEALAIMESGAAVLADLSRRSPERFLEPYIRELLDYLDVCVKATYESSLGRNWLIRINEILRIAESELRQWPIDRGIFSEVVAPGRIHLLRAECFAQNGDDAAAKVEARLARSFFRKPVVKALDLVVFVERVKSLLSKRV